MSIGQPSLSPDYDNCRVRAQHSSGVVANLVLENDGFPEESYDTALQDLVDALDAAADWTVLSASKSYIGTAAVTPTP